MSLIAETHSYDPKTVECPWKYDAELRAKAPVYYDEINDIYVVSRYDLIQEVLQKPALYSSRYMEKMLSKVPFPEEVMAIYMQGCQIKDALLVTDGETHDRHRHMITTAFSRKRLDVLAPQIDARIDELLDAALPKGSMAFRAEVGKPLPLLVTENQLRIPPEDMERAKVWSEILSSGFGGIEKSLERLKFEASEMIALQKYFTHKIEIEMEKVRTTGKGEREDDLLSLMAIAILDPADPMDMDEALSFLMNLFPATHDTTTSAMMACVHRFVENPEVQEKIAANPAYISKLIEESMRHESPVRGFWRRALEDVTLAGVDIPQGSWMLLRTSSAHRDEQAFADADAFDIDRKSSKTHFGFGTGIHICAGRFFARHIITRVITKLGQRASNFRFTPGKNQFEHIPNILASGFEELMIDFDLK